MIDFKISDMDIYFGKPYKYGSIYSAIAPTLLITLMSLLVSITYFFNIPFFQITPVTDDLTKAIKLFIGIAIVCFTIGVTMFICDDITKVIVHLLIRKDIEKRIKNNTKDSFNKHFDYINNVFDMYGIQLDTNSLTNSNFQVNFTEVYDYYLKVLNSVDIKKLDILSEKSTGALFNYGDKYSDEDANIQKAIKKKKIALRDKMAVDFFSEFFDNHVGIENKYNHVLTKDDFKEVFEEPSIMITISKLDNYTSTSEDKIFENIHKDIDSISI